MKATLHHEGERHTIRFERTLGHAPAKVWRALTENAELAHWFPAEMHGDREAGARLRFVFPAEPGEVPADGGDEGVTNGGEMHVFDPPSTLESTWEGEVLRFKLTPQGGGTLLVFTHTFTDVTKAARDASGWDVCIDALEALLDGTQATPFSPERFDELFATYAERCGPKASSRREPDV
jgi:uncharacterized protein YndB with AHSA1/START domain